MGAADAGQHGGDMRIACVERATELAIAPADAREPALQRGDGQRRPARPALHAGGEIEADGLRVRGQGIEPLTAQPGGEVPPVGVIGPLGVLRAGVAGVVARLFGQRREMGGARPLGERRAVSVRVVVFGHLVLVGAAAGRGKSDACGGSGQAEIAFFAPNRLGARIMSDKRTLSDIQSDRQARRIVRENR